MKTHFYVMHPHRVHYRPIESFKRFDFESTYHEYEVHFQIFYIQSEMRLHTGTTPISNEVSIPFLDPRCMDRVD